MCNFKDETVSERATEYATGNDFCRVFTEDMDRLYSLALLLSADEEKAEQCFAAALEDCLQGNAVFKDWTRSWSKRAVIKHAIGAVSPVPGPRKSGAIIRDRGTGPETEVLMGTVIHMEAFDRFVFVMSVLEGYSVAQSAALLQCSAREVADARLRVLQMMAKNPQRDVVPAAVINHDFPPMPLRGPAEVA